MVKSLEDALPKPVLETLATMIQYDSSLKVRRPSFKPTSMVLHRQACILAAAIRSQPNTRRAAILYLRQVDSYGEFVEMTNAFFRCIRNFRRAEEGRATFDYVVFAPGFRIAGSMTNSTLFSMNLDSGMPISSI